MPSFNIKTPNFKVIGKGINSGRKRTRYYSAINEDEARQIAEKDGTLVEEIIELPPPPPIPPTERQLAYARDLGLSIPPDATIEDVSDLISLKVDGDRPSTLRHREFSRRFGIETTKYIGKKALFERIQWALTAPGREQELLSWFVYRVYRELIGGKDDAPIQGPDDPLIQEIAERLSTDEKVIKSVRRYEGKDLIWFGEWTAPNGLVHNGGSNRTMAYKEAAKLLKQRLNLTNRLPQIPPIRIQLESFPSSPGDETRSERQKASPSGCLSIIVIAIGFSILFPVYLLGGFTR